MATSKVSLERRMRPNEKGRRKGSRATWTVEEVRILREVYAIENIRGVLSALPNRTWFAIQGKARKLKLGRPPKSVIASTLTNEGDIGFSAGMIIADGSVMERCICTGRKRGRIEGGGARKERYYSLAFVQVSMEDKESLARVASHWGVGVRHDGMSSVGNEVWRVVATGRRALDLLKMLLPYLAGTKKRRAEYLLSKYTERTSAPVVDRKKFKPFSGMK
ncbi:MAG: hypothetical protein LYZ70_00810 [Nitrososphaerales archaeon]|nr:hypothetical protein [Nitrososphaerales archaeon]